MLQVRIELTTSASPAHILPYKYRALTDCATGALASCFRSRITRPMHPSPYISATTVSESCNCVLSGKTKVQLQTPPSRQSWKAEGALLAETRVDIFNTTAKIADTWEPLAVSSIPRKTFGGLKGLASLLLLRGSRSLSICLSPGCFSLGREKKVSCLSLGRGLLSLSRYRLSQSVWASRIPVGFQGTFT